MEKPIIMLKKLHDNTWSIVAMVWAPQKKFYEHPALINLTRENAEKYCKYR